MLILKFIPIITFSVTVARLTYDAFKKVECNLIDRIERVTLVTDRIRSYKYKTP